MYTGTKEKHHSSTYVLGQQNKKIADDHFKLDYACTIHKKPLTNYIAKYQNEPGILLKYEDATELYQEDATKSADRVFDNLSISSPPIYLSYFTLIIN